MAMSAITFMAALCYLCIGMPALAVHDTSIAQTQDVPSMIANVTLLLARHGYSCANALQDFGTSSFSQGNHFGMRDPLLTTCGILKAQEASRSLESLGTVDAVLTSSLLRAIETAAHLFPANSLVPIPYISENTPGDDNTPLDVNGQTTKITDLRLLTLGTGYDRGRDTILSALFEQKIDMKWMLHHAYGPFAESHQTTASWDNFLQFVAEEIIPLLPHEASQNLRIAVVTHGSFLANAPLVNEECEVKQQLYNTRPDNNQVLSLSFEYREFSQLPRLRANQLVHLVAETCKQVYPPRQDPATMAVKDIGKPERYLCKADFGPVCLSQTIKMPFGTNWFLKADLTKDLLIHEELLLAVKTKLAACKKKMVAANTATNDKCDELAGELVLLEAHTGKCCVLS